MIPASSAGRPLDQHRVILKKISGWVKKNACEMRVFKQKTEREIELGEGDNYIKFDFTNPHHAVESFCAVDEENLILLGSSKQTRRMARKVVGVKDQAVKRRA